MKVSLYYSKNGGFVKMSFPKIRDAVFYWMGVYTACGIAHNVIRRLSRPRRCRKIIVLTGKGGGEGNV